MRKFRVTLEVVDNYNRYDAEGIRQDIVEYPHQQLGVEIVDSEAFLLESDEDSPRKTGRQ